MRCKVDVSISERDTVYTLRKATELDKAATVGSYVNLQVATPLTLEAAKAGTGGVQLVSKEIATGDDKAKPDNASYKIQGSVTPPKAADAK